YYKLNYEFSKYWPLTRALVLNTRAEVGYGDSYGKDVVRDVCYIPAPPPTEDDPRPQPPPASDPCTPDSDDYVRTISASGLPFYENFYAGGARSLRGFRDNTLGPREAVAGSNFMQPLGGALKTVGSFEMYFPTLLDSPAARISAFVDFGNVYTDIDAFEAKDFRVSAGIALMWRAPVGPISISYAYPIRKQDDVFGGPGDLIRRGVEVERL